MLVFTGPFVDLAALSTIITSKDQVLPQRTSICNLQPHVSRAQKYPDLRFSCHLYPFHDAGNLTIC